VAIEEQRRVWVGIDVGKTHHWVCAVDGEGTVVLSRKVANDQAELRTLSTEVAGLAERAVWAVDIIAAPARDLPVVERDNALVRELELLSTRRADLTADRVRLLNRLRDLMTSVFPALEREFNLKSCKGALVLLTGYASRSGSVVADRRG
jgi:hypothetical protein